MKMILCIDLEKDPHLNNIYQAVAKVINEPLDHHHFIPLSHDGVMKIISKGKLSFGEMDNEMKISQSKFYHCYYNQNNKEVVVQKTTTKIAIFSD